MNNVYQVTERMEDIAALCKHSRTTVTLAIKSLVHKGLVRQLVSKGRAYIHQLTSPLDWVQQVEDEGKSNVQMLNISNVQMLNIERNVCGGSFPRKACLLVRLNLYKVPENRKCKYHPDGQTCLMCMNNSTG